MKLLTMSDQGRPLDGEALDRYMSAPAPEGFEFTGEYRRPFSGEWFLNTCHAHGSPERRSSVHEDGLALAGYTHVRLGEKGSILLMDEAEFLRRRILRKAGTAARRSAKVWVVALQAALAAAAVYLWVAFVVFQWRNPKSNEMGFYRHFWSVVTFQRMEEYQ